MKKLIANILMHWKIKRLEQRQLSNDLAFTGVRDNG